MERYELKRDPHLLSVRIRKETFSPETLDTLRGRNDAAWLLLPETEEDGESVLLKYGIEGMKSLSETAANLDDPAMAETLRELTERLLSLSGYGLDITQVLTAFDHVMLSVDGIRLVCLCSVKIAAESADDRKTVIRQARQLVSGRESLEDLAGFLANPYCSLQALMGKLGNEKKAGKAGKTPEAKPEQKPVISAAAEKPAATAAPELPDSAGNPVQEAAPPAEAPQAAGSIPGAEPIAPEAPPETPFMPMQGVASEPEKDQPFVSTIGSPAGKTPEPKQAPAEESKAPEVRRAPAPARFVHSGADDATVDDSFVNRPQAGAAAGRRGMDDATVDDSWRPEPSAGRPEKNASGEKKEKPGKEKPEKEKPGKAKKPEQKKQPAARKPLPKAGFGQSVLILLGIVILAAALCVVAGAFLGAAGIALVLLFAAVGTAFLFSRGMLTLKTSGKQEENAPPPVAPDVGDVFTVRLRMISQNLATHQELIIRENNQIIGRDPQSCRVTVNYSGVSREHCRISCKKTGGHEEYFITDLGSKNGTKLNGERLEPDMPYPLKLGDHVTLAGKYDFKISSDAY